MLAIGLVHAVAVALHIGSGGDAQVETRSPAGRDAPAPDAVAMRLEWSAPSRCPNAETVRTDVESLARRTIVVDPEATDVLRGQITADGTGHHLVLVVDMGGTVTRRELDAERCETLGRAAGLVAAVAVAPVSTAQSVLGTDIPPPSIPGPTTSSPLTATATDDPPARSSAARRGPGPATDADVRRTRQPLDHALTLGAAVGLSLGLVPRTAAGVQGAVGWQFGPGRLEAFGGHWFGRTAVVDADAGVAVRGSGAGLRLCAAWSRGAVAVPVCVGALALALVATGRGPAVSAASVRALWLGVGPGVGVEWRLRPRLGVRGQLDLAVAARRPGFHLQQGAEARAAFRSPPLSLTLVVGPYFRLP